MKAAARADVSPMPEDVPEAQPCSWKDWGEWSRCSVTCGQGQRVRSRVWVSNDICRMTDELLSQSMQSATCSVDCASGKESYNGSSDEEKSRPKKKLKPCDNGNNGKTVSSTKTSLRKAANHTIGDIVDARMRADNSSAVSSDIIDNLTDLANVPWGTDITRRSATGTYAKTVSNTSQNAEDSSATVHNAYATTSGGQNGPLGTTIATDSSTSAKQLSGTTTSETSESVASQTRSSTETNGQDEDDMEEFFRSLVVGDATFEVETNTDYAIMQIKDAIVTGLEDMSNVTSTCIAVQAERSPENTLYASFTIDLQCANAMNFEKHCIGLDQEITWMTGQSVEYLRDIVMRKLQDSHLAIDGFTVTGLEVRLADATIVSFYPFSNEQRERRKQPKVCDATL